MKQIYKWLDFQKHLSDYFTDRYLKEIQSQIDENFIEYENNLYLVRGGRGYRSQTIDFDSIDIITTPIYS